MGTYKRQALPARPLASEPQKEKEGLLRMYAIIQTGGKQYRVEKGDVLFLEKLPAQEGDTVVFEDVFAVGEEGKVNVGSPTVAGAKVSGLVLKNGKGKKLNIITYKPKKGSVRRKGHRQPYTKVEITEISGK